MFRKGTTKKIEQDGSKELNWLESGGGSRFSSRIAHVCM